MRNEDNVGLITCEWGLSGQTTQTLRHFLDYAALGLSLVFRVLEVEGEMLVKVALREAGEEFVSGMTMTALRTRDDDFFQGTQIKNVCCP